MNAEKEKDLKFIREFSKISISKICRELNVNRPNILNGRASKEAIHNVKEEILKKIAKIC